VTDEGEANNLVKNELSLSFAINNAENIVKNAKLNTINPSVMFIILKVSIGAFFSIVVKRKMRIKGSAIPRIMERGSQKISFRFLSAKLSIFGYLLITNCQKGFFK
jgi:hypothetical protein